jgi:hypothetical protein
MLLMPDDTATIDGKPQTPRSCYTGRLVKKKKELRESDMWNQYAQLAAQYYVSGRFAALAGYVPVCGSLMHHAIELQLKCGLIIAGAVPEADADRHFRTSYRHSLRSLWQVFKGCHRNEDLSEFDRLIDALDRWEEIRYPQRRGMAILVQAKGSTPPVPASGPAMSGVSVYTLHVEEVDRFMQRVWWLMSVDPAVFEMWIRADQVPVVASVYEDNNVHMIHA